MNIFEEASRLKLRFESPRGELTVENLWDLPLSSTVANKPNLDDLAKGLNRQLKSTDDTSFVNPKSNVNAILQLKFDLVLHVLRTKQAENSAALQRRELEERRNKLREALASKEEQALTSKTADEIRAELAELEKAL